MSSNGAFDHYTSWDADYNGEIFVAYLCKPRPSRDKPQSADPANPEGISLGNVAGIFSHLEEQIDGFVQGMLAELAVPLSAYREF